MVCIHRLSLYGHRAISEPLCQMRSVLSLGTAFSPGLTTQTLYYMALPYPTFINFKWYKTLWLELSRTITRSPRSVPTSQLLSNLHWLPIHKRINFKVAILTYKPCTTRSFLLNNLLTFTTLYLTINPVVRCVPPVSLSSKCPE